MSTLSGNNPRDTYPSLVQIPGGVTGSLVAAQDGLGVTLPFSISTGIFSVTGALTASLTAANLTGALPIANGGTGQITAALGFDALSGMTTLGDTLYGGSSGTRTRLAGNTTTTRKFIRQTGDGALSAAPAWDTVTKTDVGLSNVENTALSTWAGSTSITTLGTVATGTWSATTIAINKGGTGQTTAANALTALSAAGTAITNTFAANQVIAGTLTVQQSGGTPGTDEVIISHDGSRVIFRDKNGGVYRLTNEGAPSTEYLEITKNSGGVTITNAGAGTFVWENSGNTFAISQSAAWKVYLSTSDFRLANDRPHNWSSTTAADGTADVGLARVAAKVVGVTNGSSAGGTLSSVPLTVSPTTHQDNYNPGVARIYRINPTTNITVSGMAIGQVDGQEWWIVNVSSFVLILSQ